MRRLSSLTLCFASLVALPDASAQTTELHGRVVSQSGAPVAGAAVAITSLGVSVRSDSSGMFRLSGTTGSTLRLTFSAAGYRDDSASVVLSRSRVVARDFTLVATTSAPPMANPSDHLLRGRTTDESDVPLAFATIQLNGGRRFLSDDSGRFAIPVHLSGRFSILARRIGFRPAELKFDARPDTAVRIRMTQLVLALPEQRVTGRAAFVSLDVGGFYRRMREAERGINHGYFITPEEFEVRKPGHLTHMAEGLPAVKIRRAADPRRYVIVGLDNCRMTVYLDRVRIVGKLGGVDDFVNELVDPNTIAAMEVYPRGVGAPPEYQTLNGTCGVVLLWSK
jgi:hypothetical protein